MNRRHGGALGNTGRLAFWVAALTVITGFGSWAWGGWLTALGLGAVVLATALYHSDIAPRAPGLLIGLGGGFAASAAWVFELTTDESNVLGSGTFYVSIVAGIAVYSIGLATLGWWLRSEEAVEPPTPAVPA